MSRLEISAAVRRFIARQRLAHMATASASGVPHVVPVCCVLLENTVYVSIDEKPKGDPLKLRRLRNIAENPRVAFVFDEYDDADWSRLGFVLLRCAARLVDNSEERTNALAALGDKYAQYRSMALEARPLIAADVQRATAWGTAAAYSSGVKPLVLIIRDGWGVCDEDPQSARAHGNAVLLAKLPVLDHLLATYPHCLLQASGEAVGLPPGQMGNSEVGHQNLGAGRVTYQDFMRISVAIRDGTFFRNPVLLKVMGEVKRTGNTLHLMGLVSDGGVHSHISHLFALVQMAHQQGLQRVVVHAIMDGRDTPPTSGAGYLRQLEEELARVGVGRIGTVSGRYYSMDRDNRWERTQRAYDAYVKGEGNQARSADEAIKTSYDAGKTDEFVEPTVIVDDSGPIGCIGDGDGVIFFNFRPDRARQITRCFTRSAPEGTAEPAVDVHYVCMTQYDATIGAPVAFPPEVVDDPVGEVFAAAGLRQLRIAETEKYAHVTYFFNGGREEPFSGEDRALIPSPKVATYDLKPEMSAEGITDELLKRLQDNPYDLVVLNYANADMVGHTGKLDPTIHALEVVDACVGRILDRVRQLGGVTLITGDHGNAEQMIDAHGEPLTAHTTNPVHFILVDDSRRSAQLRDGIFADVAPTMLGLIGLEVPSKMTGKSLIVG